MQTELPASPRSADSSSSYEAANFLPLSTLVRDRFNGEPEYLVAELHSLGEYIMREKTQDDVSAEQLRRMYNLIHDLAAAIDSCKAVAA